MHAEVHDHKSDFDLVIKKLIALWYLPSVFNTPMTPVEPHVQGNVLGASKALFGFSK